MLIIIKMTEILAFSWNNENMEKSIISVNNN